MLKQRVEEEKKKRKSRSRVNTASLPRCVGRGKSNKPWGHFPGRQVLVSEAGERGVESQQVERNKQREANTNTGTLCFKCTLNFSCCYLWSDITTSAKSPCLSFVAFTLHIYRSSVSFHRPPVDYFLSFCYLDAFHSVPACKSVEVHHRLGC